MNTMYMLKMSIRRLVGCGFDRWPGHTKDYKNAAHCLPVWHSVFRVGLGGGRLPMIPRHNTAAAHLTPRGCWATFRWKIMLSCQWLLAWLKYVFVVSRFFTCLLCIFKNHKVTVLSVCVQLMYRTEGRHHWRSRSHPLFPPSPRPRPFLTNPSFHYIEYGSLSLPLACEGVSEL